jgi:hypothetical protein
MSILYTLRAGLLAATPLVGAVIPAQAQQPETPAAPAQAYWYVGPQLGVQVRTYTVDRMGNGLWTRSVGLQAGYTKTHRLALQAGVQYSQGAKPDEELRGSGQFAYYPQTAQITRAWLVPASLRWSLARTPHRVELTAILGASLCFFRLRETGHNTATGTKLVTTTNGVNGFLDLGLGGRLLVSPRLKIGVDVLPNLSLSRPSNTYWPIAPGLNTVLAVNYRLN